MSRLGNRNNESSADYRGNSRGFMQDMVFSIFASLLSFLAVRWISEPIPHFTTILAKWLVASLVGSILALLSTNFHKALPRYVGFAAASRIILGVVIKDVVLALAMAFGFVKLPSTALSAVAILADFVFTIFLLLYLRRLYESFRREEKMVKSNASRKMTLIRGVSQKAVDMANELQTEGDYDVVGFISSDPHLDGSLIGNRMVYYCKDQSDLDKLVWRLGGIDCVFFTNEVITGGPSDNQTDSKQEKDTTKLEEVENMAKPQAFIKRSFDVVVSAILMVLLSPIILVCAIAVKLEDGGPVIFNQERIGQNGMPFYIHKFRSMRVDAEKNGAALAQGEEDDRLTNVGRFLRAHHLDELPQLWNVFMGDMSFVGYRPERQYYIDRIVERNPRYVYLYQIKPGVTSFATLYNGYTDTLDKMLVRLDLDLYYLRKRSIWFDLEIMGLTFLSVFSGKKF